MQSQTPDLWLQFVPIMIVGLLAIIPSAIMANLLAKEKGRKVRKWTILGAIPLINGWCWIYFIGAPNLRLEQKVDELLKLRKESALLPPADA